MAKVGVCLVRKHAQENQEFYKTTLIKMIFPLFLWETNICDGFCNSGWIDWIPFITKFVHWQLYRTVQLWLKSMYSFKNISSLHLCPIFPLFSWLEYLFMMRISGWSAGGVDWQVWWHNNIIIITYHSTARPGVSIYWLGYVENWLGWADLSIP